MAIRDPFFASKPLGRSSSATAEFNIASLAGDPIYGMDIDTLYRHPVY